MTDSTTVLNGQTIAYTCWAIAIMLLMAWFGYTITRPGKVTKVKSWFFYSFVAMLVILGVSLHLITYNTIPWAPMDLNRSAYTPDKVFDITVADHKFSLPAEKLVINSNDKVLFNVTSNDLTYGFGVFRADNSMVCQMQVVPGHKNDLLWIFDKPGLYTIRSTEYSGPKGYDMVLRDVIEVVDTPAPAAN